MDNNNPHDIINDIGKIVKRLDGLETEDINALSISRILKVYPNVGIKITITANKYKALFPSSSVYGSASLYVGGNTVLTRDD